MAKQSKKKNNRNEIEILNWTGDKIAKGEYTMRAEEERGKNKNRKAECTARAAEGKPKSEKRKRWKSDKHFPIRQSQFLRLRRKKSKILFDKRTCYIFISNGGKHNRISRYTVCSMCFRVWIFCCCFIHFSSSSSPCIDYTRWREIFWRSLT